MQIKLDKYWRDCRELVSGSERAHCVLGGMNREKQNGDGWRGSRLGGWDAGATAEQSLH